MPPLVHASTKPSPWRDALRATGPHGRALPAGRRAPSKTATVPKTATVADQPSPLVYLTGPADPHTVAASPGVPPSVREALFLDLRRLAHPVPQVIELGPS